jgi:hypothetical protein
VSGTDWAISVGLGAAVGLAIRGGPQLGQHRPGYVEAVKDVVVPVGVLQVEQHRARGVGVVGDVAAAVDPAGQVPDQPGVGVAEQEVAPLGPLPGPLHVLEDPGDLGAGEVGGDDQPGLGLDLVLVALLLPAGHDRLGAGVLPDDGVVDGLAGVLVPDDGGLALVGDADGGEVVGAEVVVPQHLGGDLLGLLPDLLGVVLDPAGLGVDLLVLHLGDAGRGAVVLEEHGPGRGGALVDREDVLLRHPWPPVREGRGGVSGDGR